MKAFKIPPIFMITFLYVNFVVIKEILGLVLTIAPYASKHPLMLFKHLYCFLSYNYTIF